jgi:hypothetical protein
MPSPVWCDLRGNDEDVTRRAVALRRRPSRALKSDTTETLTTTSGSMSAVLLSSTFVGSGSPSLGWRASPSFSMRIIRCVTAGLDLNDSASPSATLFEEVNKL